jgi:hypothetical protein
MIDRPPTLIAAGKVFWRTFAPAWAFPVVLLLISVGSDRLGHPLLAWWIFGMPFFFWAFFRATRPWLNGQIRYWHQVFWGMLVPFMVFVVLVSAFGWMLKPRS